MAELVKDKPKDAGGHPTGSEPITAQSRRRWRLMRRVVVLVIGLFGLFMFWNDQFWVMRLRDSLLNKTSTLPLSSAERAKMQEVADLLLDIYTTLAEMRFIDPSGIVRGPHDVNHFKSMPEAAGLDPSIIYLYSILPYIDVERAGEQDFFQGGRFVDFRDPGDVEESRDPFYASPEGTDFDDEYGPYMRPWVTPLSALGNHQSVIIYDARKHRIWIIDQEGGDSSDPKFRDQSDPPRQSPSQNSFEHINSRSAPEVLKDINLWYQQLKVVPGGGDGTWAGWYDEDMDLASLYRQNGWPENFDGDAFEVDQVRRYCVNRAKYDADDLPKQFDAKQRHIKALEEKMANTKVPELVSKDSDVWWDAIFTLWKEDRLLKQLVSSAEELEKVVDLYCPDQVCQRPEDLPLWELEYVKREEKYKRLTLIDAKQEGKDATDPSFLRIQKEAAKYANAVRASQAAVDRLRPGATWEAPFFRSKDDDRAILIAEKEVEKIKKFLLEVPLGAEKTRRAVQDHLLRAEQRAEGKRAQKVWNIERKKKLRETEMQ